MPYKFNPFTGNLDEVSDLSGYLPLTGGTLSGALTLADLPNAINSGNYPVQMKSGVADGATAVGFALDTTNSLGVVGSKIISISSFGVEQMWLSTTGGSFGENISTGGFSFGVANGASAVYATAMGYGNVVSASGAFAAGEANDVSGINSAAFGIGNVITSGISFVAGYYNTAAGDGANAMGYQNITGGTLYNTSIGSFNQSYGYGSVALGTSCIAGYDGTGAFDTSVAIGSAAKAIAKNSFAFGSSVTAAKQKSIAIGDTTRNAIANSVAFGVGNSYPALYVLGAESHFNSTRLAIGDTGTLSGTELVTNGTFTGSATGWTLGTGWAYNSNNVRHTSTASSGTLTQAISGLVIGNVYRLSYAMTGTSAGDDAASIGLTVAITGAARAMHFQSANGTKVEMFVATATSGTITFTPSDTFVVTLDTVSLKQVTGGALSVAGMLYATGGATIDDAKDIVVGTTTGTKIGTATTQKLGFYNATPVVQQTDGAGLTNNVTSGGTTDTIADFTDLSVYATDAAAIRNDIYQLARKVKILGDALRTYGLLS